MTSSQSDRDVKPLWKRRAHFRMPSIESPLTMEVMAEIREVQDRITLRAQREHRQRAVDRGGYD